MCFVNDKEKLEDAFRLFRCISEPSCLKTRVSPPVSRRYRFDLKFRPFTFLLLWFFSLPFHFVRAFSLVTKLKCEGIRKKERKRGLEVIT